MSMTPAQRNTVQAYFTELRNRLRDVEPPERKGQLVWCQLGVFMRQGPALDAVVAGFIVTGLRALLAAEQDVATARQ